MSVKYAPVGPLAVLQQLHAIDELGDYLLLIASDVLEHQEGYNSLVDMLDSPFIIMDNGTIEHGKPLPVQALLEAAATVDANCIVLPDILYDLQGTIAVIEQDLNELQDSGLELMKVPQGSTTPELVTCVDWLCTVVGTEGDDYWGIPRWIASEIGTRIPIVQYINMRNENPKIHLLGMSLNHADDMRCTTLPNIIGIDSANPIVLGVQGNRMATDPYAHVERGDYWARTQLTSRAVENVQYIRGSIG